jgi:two-component system LytT family sensor kinase
MPHHASPPLSGATSGHPGPARAEHSTPPYTIGLVPIFVTWLCVSLAAGGLVLLFTGGMDLRRGLTFGATTLTYSTIWTIVTVLVFRLTARFNVEDTGRAARTVVLVTAGVVLVPLVSLGESAGFALVGVRPDFGRDGPALTVTEIAMRMLPPSVLLYTVVTSIGLLREAAHRARVRREEAVRLRGQLAEARLQVLRSQLNPHFLFNTLNAVSGLMDEDPRGARRMIARLSELLRFALDGATAVEIPLHEELALVGRYLEIVEIRFQGLLDTRVSADPELGDTLVPSLILQPLVENAMQHGVGKAGGRGRIEVHAAREGDRLVLRVLDTGGPDAPAVAPDGGGGRVGGLGLRHTRERLHELYGDDHRLSLQPRPDGGMVAVIDVPYHTTPLAATGPSGGA